MRRRPWALVILACLHFLAPFGNIALNAMMTGQDILRYFIQAFSPAYLSLNWPIIAAPIVAGVAIYACKKWSFFVYLIAIVSLFFFSHSGYMSKADSVSLLPVIFVYLINILVVSYFLIPAVRNLYFDRRLRWWEIQARYRCFFKCNWWVQGEDEKYSGVIGNFSENGLFLQSPEFPIDESHIEIEIFVSPEQTLNFSGLAILHDRADAIGFGVRFDHRPETRKQAKLLVADLEAQGMCINSSDSRPEDSFSYWLRTLITTGKGLIPKKDK